MLITYILGDNINEGKNPFIDIRGIEGGTDGDVL